MDRQAPSESTFRHAGDQFGSTGVGRERIPTCIANGASPHAELNPAERSEALRPSEARRLGRAKRGVTRASRGPPSKARGDKTRSDSAAATKRGFIFSGFVGTARPGRRLEERSSLYRPRSTTGRLNTFAALARQKQYFQRRRAPDSTNTMV